MPRCGEDMGIESERCQVQRFRDDPVGIDRIEPKQLICQTGMPVCQSDQLACQQMHTGRQYDPPLGKQFGFGLMNQHRATALFLDGVQAAYMIEVNMSDEDQADMPRRNAVSF